MVIVVFALPIIPYFVLIDVVVPFLVVSISVVSIVVVVVIIIFIFNILVVYIPDVAAAYIVSIISVLSPNQ